MGRIINRYTGVRILSKSIELSHWDIDVEPSSMTFDLIDLGHPCLVAKRSACKKFRILKMLSYFRTLNKIDKRVASCLLTFEFHEMRSPSLF